MTEEQPEHNPGEPKFSEDESGEHNPGEPKFGNEEEEGSDDESDGPAAA